MSRPDTQQAEFDYMAFDSRDFHLGSQPHGHGGFAAKRDMARDFWTTKDQQQQHESPREIYPTSRESLNSFYHTPTASMSGGALGSSMVPDGRPANGHSSQLSMSAPRMYGGASAAHNVGPNGADGWNSPVGLNGTATGPGLAGNTAGNGGRPGISVPAVAQSVNGPQMQLSQQQRLVSNHHHRTSPPRPQPQPSFSPASAPNPFSDRDRDSLRDAFLARQFQQANSPPSIHSVQATSLPSPSSASAPRTTIWWGELEPWMDEEYAKQVCNLMGWDPVNIKVPRPAPDPVTGRQANNPGYCFLTFPSQAHAASVLAQVNGNSGANPLTMPNSSKQFNLNWASSVPTAPLSAPFNAPTISIPGAQNPQYPKEYSIFVGDLAPEVSNSDLVAVFRNPVLGLRNDREPRFIRPFLSCKSAKIMLDPVTGVSRGYGFVR